MSSIITVKYKIELKINVLPPVILPLISSGSFLISDSAAIGIPQFAIGPQKWVLKEYKNPFLLFQLHSEQITKMN